MEAWLEDHSFTEALTEWQGECRDASPVASAWLPSCADGLRSGSDGGSSTGSASRAKKTKKAGEEQRSVNVSRERQKHEIETLRRTAFELQDELTRLQQRREDMLRPHMVSATGQLVTVAPVWEGMAKRQFQVRRKAEQETLRLKRKLAEQARVAEDLVSLIRRAQRLEENSVGLSLMPSPTLMNVTVGAQLERLNLLSAQWFVPFSWYPHLLNHQLKFFETQVVSNDGTELVLDVCSNQAFPFPVAEVEQAIWRVFQGECTEEDYAYTQSCEASAETLVGNFSAATSREGVNGSLIGTYVTRQSRTEGGHLVLASNVYANYKLNDDVTRQEDYSLAEDTWLRILDAREMLGVVAVSDSTPLSVLQHVRRSRIRFVKSGDEDDARIHSLTKLHFTLVEEELRWGQQNLESMLMRAAPTNIFEF